MLFLHWAPGPNEIKNFNSGIFWDGIFLYFLSRD